ncbi:putative cytokinetic ring protein SteA [Nocardioides sp. AE5]|uniref:putative cytokinetic ring protein SteA n=1 Tax=Nocardioides sp. AE5 TaxID=2962573 RepID=UPI0028820F25|nr:putative cytokinetic ring protein SteA [Nocardioides sp. AE5]MDT0201549.1 putative cytokinetic ring protein SteA [Nocardioides sp. AE5]
MKLPTRRAPDQAPPGIVATARVDRQTRTLLARLQPGDIVVLDHLDMDRATARQLVDAEVAAVVNVTSFVSGRYPAQGPEVLLAAGITLVDNVGADTLGLVRDGREVRLHEGKLFVAGEEVAAGDLLDQRRLARELGAARGGMTTQLENFNHNSTEFLRREEELLLHGKGMPDLNVDLGDKAVAVVVSGPDLEEELRGIKRYLREQRPILVAVDSAADVLRSHGHKPDVIVLSSPQSSQSVETRLSAKALKAAGDVVVLVDRGAGKTPTDSLERLGVRPLLFETSASAEDAALLLAAGGHAALIVGVGVHATLEDFLDRQRGGLASTFLARLKVGPRLVDARALPEVYSGRVQPIHVFLVLLVGVIALAAAIAVTPVGQEWLDDLDGLFIDLYERIKGLVT